MRWFIKSQEHDKGLVIDVFTSDDEDCETIGYLTESDFFKEYTVNLENS